MAAVSSIVAVAGLAVAAGGAIASYTQNRAAQRSQQRAEDRAETAQQQQEAANAAQAAAAQRQQIREERIRRGAIVNAAANTGTSGSSGEAGALGSLATQQGANMGFNTASYQRGQRIGQLNQEAADFMGQARTRSSQASMYGQLGNLGSSAFTAAGGWKAPVFKKLF